MDDPTQRVTVLTDQNVFTMIMQRFDALDKANATTQFLLAKHVEDDNAVYKVVDRHATYWTLLLAVTSALVAVGGSLAVAFVR